MAWTKVKSMYVKTVDNSSDNQVIGVSGNDVNNAFVRQYRAGGGGSDIKFDLDFQNFNYKIINEEYGSSANEIKYQINYQGTTMNLKPGDELVIEPGKSYGTFMAVRLNWNTALNLYAMPKNATKITLNPIYDSYTLTNSQSLITNESKTRTLVGYSTATEYFRSLFKFNVASIDKSKIQSAKLILNIYEMGSVDFLKVYASRVTGTNNTNLPIYEEDFIASSQTFEATVQSAIAEFDVTDAVKKGLISNGFIIKRNNEGGGGSWFIHSNEVANVNLRPILEIKFNSAPTITLNTANNTTLYENDILNLSGTTNDTDPNQSVTAYYQIDDNPKRVLATNLSQMQIPLSKQLIFKGGRLFDGDVPITDVLADGVPHTLKFWAIDSEGGQSDMVERTFYVVPNRAPLLTIDTIVLNGIINTDKFTINGASGDPDANANVKVSYRINAGNAVDIYEGPGGAWEFELLLAQLKVGENTIVVEVVDNYGAKTSKTIKLNKNTVNTPILQSVARYKIEPPKGSAKGVLLFIERDADLAVKVELSMTLTGEQEQYITLTPVNTEPTNSGTVEDTFEHTVSEEKQNIILKITPSRTDLSFNHKIHLISGAVD
ncbi:DNRLRE domain-containing protein [Lysinibacillus fusiformis]|uniref:DNRLRE domain-containing protein n=1 Tax=Lysinibacillus fusiformis TaxID=28031 RepID=UPI0019684742|nr:DNRLRE domain-containing protein [Lysinibacillus fusiformis]QSB09651.1 DNRLRE domain-containing protein [Lysinibacillus fusiformis]